MDKIHYSWRDVETAIDQLVISIEKDEHGFDTILAIARGGLVPAAMLSHRLEIKEIKCVHASYYKGTERKIALHLLYPIPHLKETAQVLIVDDIVDTGITLWTVFNNVNNYRKSAVLVQKTNASIWPDYCPNVEVKWVVFPWEKNGLPLERKKHET